ncbi:MAG: hypothetical protein ACXWLM_03430, partial [Myxococcales bacterium]
TERELVTAANPQGSLSRSQVEPALVRHVVLVTWNESSDSPAVRAFADEVRRQSRTWPGSGSGRGD